MLGILDGVLSCLVSRGGYVLEGLCPGSSVRTPDTLQMSQFGTLQAACQSLKGSSPSG